jgi:multidrug transporter EmrE-like cation transporter
LNVIVLLAGCVLLSAAASIFLKIGAATLTGSLNFSSLASNPMILVGAVFYSAAFLGYIYVLRLIPLSLAQPIITAGVSAVTALVAVIFFREQMMMTNWIGLTLICIGIFFLFLGRT